MSENRKKQTVINHLKQAGLDNERIEEFLDLISIEEAYANLQKNKILKKVSELIGMDEIERRAISMGMTTDVFAKEFDRWNYTSGIKLISRGSEPDNDTKEL